MTTATYTFSTCVGTFRLIPRRSGYFLSLHQRDGRFENLGFHGSAEVGCAAVCSQRTGVPEWDSLPAVPPELGGLAHWDRRLTAIASRPPQQASSSKGEGTALRVQA